MLSVQAYGGNVGVAARILNIDARERYVVSFIPRPLHPLPPKKKPSIAYLLNQRLIGPRIQSGRCGESKTKILSTLRIEPRFVFGKSWHHRTDSACLKL